jgi:tRNA(adenine34) deaminase
MNQEILNSVMQRALDLARAAADEGEVPVGAVVVDNETGSIIGEGRNRRERDNDPLAHAEIEAMRAAARTINSWNLSHATLVVTLEPCPMCAGAAVMAHIGRIVFGAWDSKMGACGSVWDIARDPHIGYSPEVIGGVFEAEATQLLGDFFARKRD